MIDWLAALFRLLAPLWTMSLTAAFAAAVVLVLRLILKRRAPRNVICLLWLIVFARLLIPFSLESHVSLVPAALTGQGEAEVPVISAPRPADPVQADTPSPVQAPVQPGLAPASAAPADPQTVNSVQPAAPDTAGADASGSSADALLLRQAVLAGAWLAGVSAMAGYALVSYAGLRRRVFAAIQAEDGAWEHPQVCSPFILGFFRPKIYLPAGMTGPARQYILCHEQAHLRRRDYLLKPICWAVLALHWFNPMVWAAYLLMSRDIEIACDQAVIRQLGPAVKADYSYALLELAANGHFPTPCPISFGEGDAKVRIRSVLSYKRPAAWIAVMSALAVTVAAVCLLTDPIADAAGLAAEGLQKAAGGGLAGDVSVKVPASAAGADHSAGSGSVTLSLSGDTPVLNWDGTNMELSDPITADNLTGLYCRDLDDDGTAEVAVTYLHANDGVTNPIITVYERSGSKLIPYSYDTVDVVWHFLGSIIAAYQADKQNLIFNHYDGFMTQGGGYLDISYFDGYEDLIDQTYRGYTNQLSSLTLNGSAFQAVLEPVLSNDSDAYLEHDLSIRPSLYAEGRPVARLEYTLTYTGSGFELGGPSIELYSYGPDTSGNLASGATALSAYRAALEGSAFIGGGGDTSSLTIGRQYTIDQVFADQEFSGLTPTQLTVTDLDLDGVPEAALLYPIGNGYTYLILRYHGGVVYGYTIYGRSFQSLKTDGTFSFSYDAGSSGTAQLHFTDRSYTLEYLADSSLSSPRYDNTLPWYEINHTAVTQSEFEDFEQQQNAKADVIWYDFTDSSIQALFP